MEIEARNRLLGDIAETLRQGRAPESISVRELIGWFDALRRGSNVNWYIRRSLEQAGLVTIPDFEGAHIDGRVQFALPPPPQAEAQPEAQPEPGRHEPAPEAQPQEPEPIQFVGGAGVEPAYRVSRLLRRARIRIRPVTKMSARLPRAARFFSGRPNAHLVINLRQRQGAIDAP